MTPLVVLPHRQGLCLCPLHVKGYAACAVAPVRASRDGCECADASGTCAPLLRTWLLSQNVRTHAQWSTLRPDPCSTCGRIVAYSRWCLLSSVSALPG